VKTKAGSERASESEGESESGAVWLKAELLVGIQRDGVNACVACTRVETGSFFVLAATPGDGIILVA
jgi:hypothetical protein